MKRIASTLGLLALTAAAPPQAEPGPKLAPGALVAHPSDSRAANVAAVRDTPWGRHERARRARRLSSARTRCVTPGATLTQKGPATSRDCREPRAR